MHQGNGSLILPKHECADGEDARLSFGPVLVPQVAPEVFLRCEATPACWVGAKKGLAFPCGFWIRQSALQLAEVRVLHVGVDVKVALSPVHALTARDRALPRPGGAGRNGLWQLGEELKVIDWRHKGVPVAQVLVGQHTKE
jgi:hypothetical protein